MRFEKLDKSEVPDSPDHEEESELDIEASQIQTIKWKSRVHRDWSA